MANNLFNKKENIQMLWDVISDEEIFKFLTPNNQSNVYNIFISNIQNFYKSEKMNNTLVDLNKKYIVLILNYINNNYPYQPSKIKIHSERPNKELITYEEIHNEKQSQFEKDLSKRQEEFESSMTLKAPPVPEFADKESDKPIKEMDRILKEMQTQRNYEVEQINRTYNTSNQLDNWLKPQETSLKSDKFQNNDKLEETQNNRFKYINSLDQNIKKNVSFSDENEIRTFNDTDNFKEENLFSKLKKINEEDNNFLNKQNLNNNDRITNLEKNIEILKEKMDKIIDLMIKKL
jgi:hypothetical protein